MDNQQIIELISSCPTLTGAFRKQISIHCSTATNPQVILGEKQCFFLSGKLSFNQKREKKKFLKDFLRPTDILLLLTEEELSLSHIILFCFHFPWLTFHSQVGSEHNFTFLTAELLSVLTLDLSTGTALEAFPGLLSCL